MFHRRTRLSWQRRAKHDAAATAPSRHVPGLDPLPAQSSTDRDATATLAAGLGRRRRRRTRRVPISATETVTVDHGSVVIAAITSLHEHLEPVGDAGGRTAREEGGRARPAPEAVGQDQPGAGLARRHRLPEGGRPRSVPGRAGLPDGRLRLHHLHRQQRPAARRRRGRGRRAQPDRRGRAQRQPQLRGAHPRRRCGPRSWPRRRWSSPTRWPAPWTST